jgi:hypothetical protein
VAVRADKRTFGLGDGGGGLRARGAAARGGDEADLGGVDGLCLGSKLALQCAHSVRERVVYARTW